jgi:hypothetical protein
MIFDNKNETLKYESCILEKYRKSTVVLKCISFLKETYF